MKLFRWAGVTCVAAVGLVLAFAAGVWYVKSAGEPVAGENPPPQPPLTSAKRQAPPTTQKEDYLYRQKPSVPMAPAADLLKPEAKVERPSSPTPLPSPFSEVAPADPKPVPPPPPLPPVRIPEETPPPPPVDSMPHIGPFPESKKIDPPVVPDQRLVPPVVAPPAPPPVQYVNKPDLEFEYAVGTKGKSGVRDVRLLVRDTALVGKPDTPRLPPAPTDQPQKPRPTGHWTEADAAAVGDEKTPKLRYTLPAEGKYDFRLKVTANNGNAADVKDTDPPDLTVVLDTTPPEFIGFTAQVSVSKDRSDPPGWVVIMAWKVNETNPSQPEKTVFEYKLSAGQEWKPMNDVRHSGDRGAVWPVPEDAPAEVSLRITVTDRAGNSATKTIDRLNLDTTIPDGKLTKVRAVEMKKKDEPLPPPNFDPKR